MTLREIGCTLPIELYYNGDDDLHFSMKEIIHRMDIKTIDISKILKKELKVQGWFIKPLSMLLSSFQEFIFIDADALFFQNPQVIFDWKRYQETGTVYFLDRTLKTGGEERFLQIFSDIVSVPSSYAHEKGRMFKGITTHEAESGVIAMDKTKGGLHVLLMASLMNLSPIVEELCNGNHGDKESYWQSSEFLKVPYSWAPGAGGSIGYMIENEVCGALLHVDEDEKLLWFNGGIYKNKRNEYARSYYPFTHYALDRDFRNVSWKLESAFVPPCMAPAAGNTYNLSVEDVKKIHRMRKVMPKNPFKPQKFTQLQWSEIVEQADYEMSMDDMPSFSN